VLRGLLLALVLLTSAVPAGACVCELLHIPHEHADGPADADDCPCHCKSSPRVTTVPTTPAVEGHPPAAPPLVSSDGPFVSPVLPLIQFRIASPPGPDPARPRYLAVSRLLI
jgi:hypothetical protein